MIRRAVILRHTLPDGSWHRDWLIEPPADASTDGLTPDLVSFRLPPDAVRPGLWPGSFECDRLPPHRRLYLTFEGPIAGDRGQVVREADLAVVWESLDDSAAALWITGPAGRRLWTGRRLATGRWLWQG